MTARRWLLTANSTIAGVLGLVTVILLFGRDADAPKEIATLVLMFVLPAVLAAAVATWQIGWRGLARPSASVGGTLMLAIWTTFAAFAIYFLIVALLVMPWTMLIAQPGDQSMMHVLGTSLLAGGVVMAFATVLGLLPAVALCWWTSTLATRRRRVELANSP